MPLDLGLGRPAALLGVVRRHVLRRRRLLAAVLATVSTASVLAATRDAPPVTVGVVVAAHDLASGEVLDRSDLRTVPFGPGSVPTGLATDPAGRVLAAPLTRGTPVSEVALVGPSVVLGRADLRALPLRLPDAGAVALLRVGDEIDLVASDPQTGESTTVASRAVVLALPAADEATGPTGLPGRLVVLGVTPAVVSRVSDAAARLLVTFAWSAR